MSAAFFRTWINFTWMMMLFRFSRFFQFSLFTYFLLYCFCNNLFFIECYLIRFFLIYFDSLIFVIKINCFNWYWLWFILFMMMSIFWWFNRFF